MLLNHLPSLDKVHCLFLQKGRNLSIWLLQTLTKLLLWLQRLNKFVVTGKGGYNGNKDRGGYNIRTKEEKTKLICKHCNDTRRETSTYFILHGA